MKKRRGGSALSARQGGAQLGEAETTTASRGLAFKRVRDDVRITPEYVRSLYLSTRDQAIVAYLNEVGYATAEQLGALFFHRLRRPIKKARERLKKLWESHVLDRVVAEPLVKYGFSLQLAYMVGTAGRIMLAELDPKRKLPAQRRGGLLLAHNALLGQALVNLFLGLCQDGERELSFYGERGTYRSFQWGSRFLTFRPDGLLIIRSHTRDREMPMFIELDTGQREVSSFVAKAKLYDAYYKHGDVRERYQTFPVVLVVVWAPSVKAGEAGDRHRRRLADRRLAQVMELIQAERGNAQVRWAFARLDTIATDPWHLLGRDGTLRQHNVFAQADGSDGGMT